ncbi:MAG: hypothetical protein AAFY15_06805 [Cyanobacteria bacterium J06648_11]
MTSEPKKDNGKIESSVKKTGTVQRVREAMKKGQPDAELASKPPEPPAKSNEQPPNKPK